MGESIAVGLVTGSFLPVIGGAEVGLHNIAERLVRLGHRPIVFAPPRSWLGLRRMGWKLPYPVKPLPPKLADALKRAPELTFAAMDRYCALMERWHGIDLWHATIGFPTGVLAAHYCVKKKRPVIVGCVGDDIQSVPEVGYGVRRDGHIDGLVRDWLPHARALIALTDSVVTEYRALSVPESRIARIPYGVDLARFACRIDRRAIRDQLGIADTDVLVLSVGRYHEKKDFEGLLQAFALAREQGADRAKLVLAGSGLSRLEPLARKLGIKEHVRITEPKPGVLGDRERLELPPQELVELYKAADVFAFLSRVETFGIVLAEAMAAGLPVLTTDAPGCRDVVRAGRDGLIVPPGQPEAAAQLLVRLVEDEEHRRDMSQRALRRAQDFSWNSVVAAHVDLYRTIMRE